MCEELYLVRLYGDEVLLVHEKRKRPRGLYMSLRGRWRSPQQWGGGLRVELSPSLRLGLWVEPEEPPGLPPLDSLLSLGCFRMRVVLFPQRLERHAGGGRISRS